MPMVALGTRTVARKSDIVQHRSRLEYHRRIHFHTQVLAVTDTKLPVTLALVGQVLEPLQLHVLLFGRARPSCQSGGRDGVADVR